MRAAREAIGEAVLTIDSNSACTKREALAMAALAEGLVVDWYAIEQSAGREGATSRS